jgi:farnesyl diphosphate synthase
MEMLSLVDYLLFKFHESTQVACALLISGENLDNHIDVKNILVEMGVYFQVQVNFWEKKLQFNFST